jgi:hypothetical protein
LIGPGESAKMNGGAVSAISKVVLRQGDKNTMAESDVIANQKLILENQHEIKANQKTIKENQAAILKNQATLNTIVANQEKILALLKK